MISISNNFELSKTIPIIRFKLFFLQLQHFQYQFLQNITLNTQTKEQIEFTLFSSNKTFRLNNHIVWDAKLQHARKMFTSQFSQVNYFSSFFTANNENKNPHVHISPHFPVAHLTSVTLITSVSTNFQTFHFLSHLMQEVHIHTSFQFFKQLPPIPLSVQHHVTAQPQSTSTLHLYHQNLPSFTQYPPITPTIPQNSNLNRF